MDNKKYRLIPVKLFAEIAVEIKAFRLQGMAAKIYQR